MKTQQERDAANAARRLASRLARRNAAMEAMQRRHDAALAASQARMAILTDEERETLKKAEAVQAKLEAYDKAKQGAMEGLYLTARTSTALDRAGIKEVADLAAMSDLDILKIPNLGRKALREIRDAIAAL